MKTLDTESVFCAFLRVLLQDWLICRILTLNHKMRTIIAQNYPGVYHWSTMWHYLEALVPITRRKKVFTPDYIHLRDRANEILVQTLLNVLCNDFQKQFTSNYLCCTKLDTSASYVFFLWWISVTLGAILAYRFWINNNYLPLPKKKSSMIYFSRLISISRMGTELGHKSEQRHQRTHVINE